MAVSVHKWLLNKFRDINHSRMDKHIDIIAKNSGKSKAYIKFDIIRNFLIRGTGYTDYFRCDFITRAQRQPKPDAAHMPLPDRQPERYRTNTSSPGAPADPLSYLPAGKPAALHSDIAARVPAVHHQGCSAHQQDDGQEYAEHLGHDEERNAAQHVQHAAEQGPSPHRHAPAVRLHRRDYLEHAERHEAHAHQPRHHRGERKRMQQEDQT